MQWFHETKGNKKRDGFQFFLIIRETFPYHRRSLNFSSTDDCCVLPEERRWEWEEWLAREMERKSRTKN